MRRGVPHLKGLVRWHRIRKEAARLDQDLLRRDGFQWQRLPDCAVPLYDAGAAQIGRHLYIFGGYLSLDQVSDRIRIFDLEARCWLDDLVAPANLPQSHCAVTSDGERYIYCASGQLGAQCSPAVKGVFSFDTVTETWTRLPEVPAPRYGATMQLWRGQLHFVGGAKEDRWTPSNDHWTLAVCGGEPLEGAWQSRTPIPTPGMHRGSAILNDQLFVFGGQQGDFMATEGDPDCRCTGRTQEAYLADSFCLDDPIGTWKRLADMPIPVSHSDFCTLEHDQKIFIFGGQTYKDPDTFYLRLTDAVQVYDPVANQWSVAGHLPYRLKLPTAGVWEKSVVLVGGQRGKRDTDFPGPVSADCWGAQLPELSSHSRTIRPTSFFRGKSVLMLNHEISYSGAPLLLFDTAQMLIKAGATVRVASLADDTAGWTLASKSQLPIIPFETAPTHAKTGDFVIANTMSPRTMDWIKTQKSVQPDISKKLVCWVHEIDVEHFFPDGFDLKDAGLVIFDSEACRRAWAKRTGELDNSVVIHPCVTDAMMAKLTSTKARFPQLPDKRETETIIDATRDDVRAKLGVGKQDFLVLCLGTVEPRKGQAMLLKTLAKKAHESSLPIKLLLVGFRNRRRRAVFLARLTRKERAVLSSQRAYVWQQELAAFYSAADAFVMNTQGIDGKNGECFGRVTIEAMASGAVALGTASGGTVEIIDDGRTGLLFPVGADGQAKLAEKIETLIGDQDLASKLSANGMRRAQKAFSERRFFDEFEAALSRHFEKLHSLPPQNSASEKAGSG